MESLIESWDGKYEILTIDIRMDEGILYLPLEGLQYSKGKSPLENSRGMVSLVFQVLEEGESGIPYQILG